MKNRELLKRILTSLVLLPLVFFMIVQSNNLFFSFFLIIVFLLSAYEWNYINQKNHYYKLFGFLFLIFSFLSAYSLRGNNIDSMQFFLFILLTCIFSDIGGYTFGKLIGGKKLTSISPNKTYSGSIGSFIFSYIPIIILSNINFFDFFLIIDIKNIILVLLISLVAQTGDIFISYFKRLNKLKNTGNLLPGHGGLLDRIDGIIFVIPLIFIMKLINII